MSLWSFDDYSEPIATISFASYKKSLKTKRSWYGYSNYQVHSKPFFKSQWRLNGRDKYNQRGWRFTNKLFRSKSTELQKQDEKKAISKANRYKKNKYRKSKMTLTHQGFYGDNRYFGQPDEPLCLKAYMRYYNWKNDKCKKIDHPIYEYDYKYFDLCHKEKSYITRKEHYDFYFQVLSILKPGMLCYYRSRSLYDDDNKTWYYLYYIADIELLGDGCMEPEDRHGLKLTLISDWIQNEKFAETITIYKDDSFDWRINPSSLCNHDVSDLLPFCPFDWRINPSSILAGYYNNIMYLNINSPNFICWNVVVNINNKKEALGSDCGCFPWHDHYHRTTNEIKFIDSIKFYLFTRNSILSRFCTHFENSINFYHLPNLWIENGVSNFIYDTHEFIMTQAKIELKFYNNYSICIIYNFITKEWKLPTVENCPNWLQYPCIEPVKFKTAAFVEMKCFINEQMISMDESNNSKDDCDHKIEQLFDQFSDNVDKKLIEKVPLPGFYYLQDKNGKLLFNLLICGYISRFIKSRRNNVKNWAFFNVNDLNSIIYKYYGKCYQCNVTQYEYQGACLSPSRVFDYGDKLANMIRQGITLSAPHHDHDQFTHRFLLKKNINISPKTVEQSQQRKFCVKWIGSRDDSGNDQDIHNFVLRFGIEMKFDRNTGADSNYQHRYHGTSRKTFIDIVCINNCNNRKIGNHKNLIINYPQQFYGVLDRSGIIAAKDKIDGSHKDCESCDTSMFLTNNDLIEMKFTLDEKHSILLLDYYKNGAKMTSGKKCNIKMNYGNKLRIKRNTTSLMIDLNKAYAFGDRYKPGKKPGKKTAKRIYTSGKSTEIACNMIPFVLFLPVDGDLQSNVCNQFTLYRFS